VIAVQGLGYSRRITGRTSHPLGAAACLSLLAGAALGPGFSRGTAYRPGAGGGARPHRQSCRGFVAVGKTVSPYLSEPRLRKSAPDCAGADSRHEDGSHHSNHQLRPLCRHDRLHPCALYPTASRPLTQPGRAQQKPLTRRSRSCWFGHIPGLLDSKGPLMPERLQAWQWRKLRPGQT
jgi:hypothetical protein